MATKWNAFLYRRWAKTLSFLLALAMSVGFLLLGSAASIGTNRDGDSLFSREFTRTSAFQSDVGNVINYAAQMLRRFISEEAMNDGTAFAPEKNARLDQLEKEIIRTIQQHKDGLQDYIRGRQGDQGYYEYYEPADRGEVETTMVYNYYNNLSDNFYTVVEGEIVVDEEAIRRTLTEQTRQELRRMEAGFRNDYEFAKEWLEGTASLQYAVIDMDDGRAYTNMAGETYQEAVESMPWYAYKTSGWGFVNMAGDVNYLYVYEHDVSYYVGFDEEAALAMAKPDRIAGLAQSFHGFQQKRIPVFAAMALLLALCCLCALHLILVTGRKSKDGPVVLCKLDRVWNFLHWGGGALLWFAAIQYITSRHYSSHSEWQIGLLAAALITLLILPELVLSIARHAKNKTVLKNTVWYKLWQALRSVRLSSMKRATQLILLGFVLWNLLTAFALALLVESGRHMGLFWFLLFLLPAIGGTAAYLLLLRHATALDEIRAALQQAKQGNLSSELNPEHMPAGMKALAEGILGMRQGMDAAVRQAVAGERMRTELITNVSHDLKTPLTSVINYVDLLRREGITEEERGDYLATLAQKSEQLGRLVEDLVEASKASSGTVELRPVEVNLHELALQAVGENSDSLTAQGIELIIQAPEEIPAVWADSQKTWRIIENLMSNVKKYTMPGTRVYLQLTREGGFGGLVIKNISSAPLNIPAEELTQRFVRGDMVRSGEGSGLGLSIADSLCKAQGGRFELQADGDLFKAGMWLPLAG